MKTIALILRESCTNDEAIYECDVMALRLSTPLFDAIKQALALFNSAPNFVKRIALDEFIFDARYFGSDSWEESHPDLLERITADHELWEFPRKLCQHGQQAEVEELHLRRVGDGVEIFFQVIMDDYTCQQFTNGIPAEEFLSLFPEPSLV